MAGRSGQRGPFCTLLLQDHVTPPVPWWRPHRLRPVPVASGLGIVARSRFRALCARRPPLWLSGLHSPFNVRQIHLISASTMGTQH